MEPEGNATPKGLQRFWHLFRCQTYERKVRYNEQLEACGKNLPACDYNSPTKVGVALGWKQWSYTTFVQRDWMCAALSINDLDELVRIVDTWKDSPACIWYAKVQIGEPRVYQLPMTRVPVWASPGGRIGGRGCPIDIWGRTAVANTQQVAARKFAELLIAWPNSPEHKRYCELCRKLQSRQGKPIDSNRKA